MEKKLMIKDERVALGAAIRKVRMQQGLTQAELNEKMGFSPSDRHKIWSIEKGLSRGHYENVYQALGFDSKEALMNAAALLPEPTADRVPRKGRLPRAAPEQKNTFVSQSRQPLRSWTDFLGDSVPTPAYSNMPEDGAVPAVGKARRHGSLNWAH